MPFIYTQHFLDQAFTYINYRQYLNEQVTAPIGDDRAEKMRSYISGFIKLMEEYDNSYKVSDELIAALKQAPATTWLVITEGWCGDAAYALPLLAAIEKAAPDKVKLRCVLRDSNLELIDANLTEGGRSIPKLIILREDLHELDKWGPRPAALQPLVKEWKAQGLPTKEYMQKAHDWYTNDNTNSTQQELIASIKAYSV